jgi:cysteine desulfuration protein SufE
MSNLPPKLERIVEKFQKHPDPKKRYQQLLWYGQKKLPPMDDVYKTPENKVKGCVSQVFIYGALQDGVVNYQGDSDAQLVKGLVAVLLEGLNGLSPDAIVAIQPDFIEAMGINGSLTPSRANGFYNIFRMMQAQAAQFGDAIEA